MMKLKVQSFLILSFLSFLSSCNENVKTNYKHLYKISFNITEVDSKFLITEDQTIIYTANSNDKYELFKNKNGITKKISKNVNSLFSPFIVKNKIAALYDNNGDENYKTTDTTLLKYTNNNSIDFIKSTPRGRYLLMKLRKDSNLFIIDLEREEKQSITTVNYKIHGAVFDKNENFVAISFDQRIIIVELKKMKLQEIATDIQGEKLNPFIYKNNIYFVNNFNSEYYKIFKFNFTEPNSKTKIFFETSKDLRMPKIKDNYLYFVEVVNSQYLLKQKRIGNSKIKNLTNRGVVYNYSFLDTEKVVLSYSDFFTPRNIIILNIRNKNMVNISGNSINISANYKFLPRKYNLSSGYELYPTSNEEVKGIILFFHPGLHSDFSPRWDTILMTLVEKGYKIFAPNYPMSCGYGKSYFLSGLEDAVSNMVNWKNYLKHKYNSEPLYFMSASSGNIIMENVLDKNNRDVTASIALFGLPGIQPQDKTFYILGMNDPLVNYNYRYNQLKKYQTNKKKLAIKSYKDEGHWFRRRKNITDAIVEILNYFENIKN